MQRRRNCNPCSFGFQFSSYTALFILRVNLELQLVLFVVFHEIKLIFFDKIQANRLKAHKLNQQNYETC